MKFTRIVAFALATVAPAAFAGYSLQPYQALATGSWPDAVAIGDVNGDGRNDVVMTTTYYFAGADDNKVFVFLQKADGTLDLPRKYSYEAPTSNTTGLALADLDGDGQMEVAVGHGGGITILDWGPVHGRMGMRTKLYPYEGWGWLNANDVVVVDVNRDGALDVVAQSWSYGANIYFGDGHGGITRQVQMDTPAAGYNDLESGDFNHDGYQDVVVLSGQGATHAYVYYNDGSDDFSAPLEIDPNPGTYDPLGALGHGDFDADGRDDLVVMSDRTHVSLYRQDANGGLQAPIALVSNWDPQAIIGHDLDLDGQDDLIAQHSDGSVGVYLQSAAGLAPEVTTPGPPASFNTQGLAAGDINGDACPDIATANYNAGLVIHLGSGCNATADLAANVGMTPTIVAVRLDSIGDAAATAPEVIVTLALSNGSLALEPAGGCTVQSKTTRSATMTCKGSTLPAGTSRTMLMSIAITGGDSRTALSVSAIATTTTPELHLENNRASGTLRLGLVSTITPALSTAKTARQALTAKPAR